MPSFGPGLHDYTSGHWLFNEYLRLRERQLNFNINELAKAICNAVHRPLEDLRSINKFAEGGFNRMLEATFHDGKQILARLPFRLEAPLRRSVSSEAATLSFLHQNNVPVPELLAYSSASNNAVGIEYILLEKLPGKPLGERWFSLDNKSVAKVMKLVVDIEQKYMNLQLPASGSLYFEYDLLPTERRTALPQLSPKLAVDRGPWHDYVTCFEAAAKRELAFCLTYGKPRHNVERYLRELDKLELQDPKDHAELLEDYLHMVSHLQIPQGHPLARPTLRHPDLSPNNILVNDDLDIVGLIDWQHTAVLPLCVCAGIPGHFQNWGDPVSESLQKPETKLPEGFDSLDLSSKEEIRERTRKQLVHFYYAALTMKKAEAHFDAFRDTNSMLRAKLYARASAPWEGSSLALEHVLVEAQQRWPLSLKEESIQSDNTSPCPVQYSPTRIQSCLARVKAEEEKLAELEDMRAMLGIDSVGWVENNEHLVQTREMREAMRSVFLREAENDMERIAVQEHFAFHDHHEE